jgi:hypothetical protein
MSVKSVAIEGSGRTGFRPNRKSPTKAALAFSRASQHNNPSAVAQDWLAQDFVPVGIKAGSHRIELAGLAADRTGQKYGCADASEEGLS